MATSKIGSPHAVWDTYDPYGTRTVLDANWTPDADGVSDVSFTHGHQGGRHDAVTDLAHFRFRDLDPELGRWNRQDPLGYVDGASTYQDRHSSPATLRDELGLSPTLVLARLAMLDHLTEINLAIDNLEDDVWRTRKLNENKLKNIAKRVSTQGHDARLDFVIFFLGLVGDRINMIETRDSVTKILNESTRFGNFVPLETFEDMAENPDQYR